MGERSVRLRNKYVRLRMSTNLFLLEYLELSYTNRSGFSGEAKLPQRGEAQFESRLGKVTTNHILHGWMLILCFI